MRGATTTIIITTTITTTTSKFLPPLGAENSEFPTCVRDAEKETHKQQVLWEKQYVKTKTKL